VPTGGIPLGPSAIDNKVCPFKELLTFDNGTTGTTGVTGAGVGVIEREGIGDPFKGMVAVTLGLSSLSTTSEAVPSV
jgi:hypothetical protein